ncbi:MAG: hypothetical protein WC147_07815 [Syntrophomonas sp.]
MFKNIKLFSCTALIIFMIVTPCMASTNYLYNSETGETSIIDQYQKPAEVIKGQKFSLEESLNKSSGASVTRWTYEELVEYQQSSAYVNYKAESVGTHIINNNTGNTVQGSFVAQYSGAFTQSATVSGTTSAELDLMKVKAGASISGGCTNSRTYTVGTSYGTSVTINPYQTISIAGYIPGVSTQGRVKYAVINGGNGDIQGYNYYPRGSMVPSRTYFYTQVSNL